MANESAPSKTRGHKKKARTRLALLEAGVHAFATYGAGMTVQHVIGEAGVSNGTFYNYFDDLEGLVNAVVVHVVTQLNDGVANSAGQDPAQRFAIASIQMLQLLAGRPDFAQVVLRLSTRTDLDDVVFVHLRADLAEGRASGRFRDDPHEVTEDIVVGTLLACLRRICAGRWARDRAKVVVKHILELLGVPSDQASALVIDATAPPSPLSEPRKSP